MWKENKHSDKIFENYIFDKGLNIWRNVETQKPENKQANGGEIGQKIWIDTSWKKVYRRYITT